MTKSMHKNGEKDDIFNIACWIVTFLTTWVPYSLSVTVQGTLLVRQCLQHCPPCCAPWSVHSVSTVIFA